MHAVHDHLRALTLADIGPCVAGKTLFELRPNLPKLRTITTLNLAETDTASVAVFIVPPKLHLPFHDHPGMCVACKVLNGTLTVTGFDWKDPKTVKHGGPGEAIASFVGVNVESNSENSDLYMISENSGGVVHEMRNDLEHEPLVFCDVITPPYSFEDDQRPCTYYKCREVPEGARASDVLRQGQEVLLSPIPQPHIPMHAIGLAEDLE